MTSEAMNRKLAEWMGFSAVKYSDAYGGWQGYVAGKIYTQPIPNYAGSLDAVAEVEARLSKIEKELYFGRLSRLDHCGKCATAPQRSEALCRTLGLWEEDV